MKAPRLRQYQNVKGNSTLTKMKKLKRLNLYKIIKATTALSLLFLTQFSFSQGLINKDQTKILFLKSFYQEYIKTYQIQNGPPASIDPIIKKYCSKSLIIELDKLFKSGKLDYDPFLHAQDVLPNWPNVFNYKKDPKVEDQFIVSYIDPDSKKRENIYLLIMELNGKLLINKVH